MGAVVICNGIGRILAVGVVVTVGFTAAVGANKKRMKFRTIPVHVYKNILQSLTPCPKLAL